ncbi:ATP-binding cassette domain-containing protein [uncultured Gemella sp.]|uniref:ATP-binding cassette domain-containing protein n=1 Tax=uncultured Gemella sp. TaxID=254352 RepID=UPI0028D71CFA|nr:ATP-binding cassette domain-containing protein [uncultured Gemella sp.]
MKLTIDNINKKFSKKIVLNNVSFTVSTGEIVALIGRNGSGKTTLLKILSGIYSQDSGEIGIEGVDNKNIKKQLIYIPDRFDYFKNSKIKKVCEFYKLAYENFDEQYFKTELENIKLSQTNRLSELSKGQLTIFSLILGISCRTKFILLDEPLDGIDVINTKVITNYILDAQSDGIGLLISSHQLNALENISDKVVYLDDGVGVSEEVNKDEYSKYQLVYQEKISEELRRNPDVRIISNIGRVYVVIMRGSYEVTQEIIQDKDLLQYDKLSIALEDIFLLNSKGEDENV